MKRSPAKIKAAIFDVDDTLLDNQDTVPGRGLHERSRREATREVGRRHHIAALADFSVEDAHRAFREASVHTIEGALWQTLRMAGVVDGELVDPNHPLLQEMLVLKHNLHEKILLEEGAAMPGAVAFVKALAEHGLRDKLAIASTAIRRDIDIFFAKTGLDAYFPESRIVSREQMTQPKPHPEAFNLAYATLGLPERDRPFVYAFEDDPRGIASAQAAGLYVCALTSRYSRADLLALPEPPRLVADSFAEFAKLLGL